MRAYDLSNARWSKSSYSNAEGGDCVEVAHDFPGAAWQKSSYSNGEGGNCVEVARNVDRVIPVRDSKQTDGPVLLFPAESWTTFLKALETPHP